GSASTKGTRYCRGPMRGKLRRDARVAIRTSKMRRVSQDLIAGGGKRRLVYDLSAGEPHGKASGEVLVDALAVACDPFARSQRSIQAVIAFRSRRIGVRIGKRDRPRGGNPPARGNRSGNHPATAGRRRVHETGSGGH